MEEGEVRGNFLMGWKVKMEGLGQEGKRGGEC